jgi:hypothetical protein
MEYPSRSLKEEIVYMKPIFIMSLFLYSLGNAQWECVPESPATALCIHSSLSMTQFVRGRIL